MLSIRSKLFLIKTVFDQDREIVRALAKVLLAVCDWHSLNLKI